MGHVPHSPHPPHSPTYGVHRKSRFLAAESRRLGMTVLVGRINPWASLGLGEWGFLPSVGMTWVMGGGMTSRAVCDYAVGKVAAEKEAAGTYIGYGIICSVVQSIVPFSPIL